MEFGQEIFELENDFGTNELDSFNFDITNFDTDNIFTSDKIETRYIKPPLSIDIKEKFVKYSYAEKLAKDITLKENERIYAIVNGSFVFGDLIEALAVTKNLKIKEMTISTLSLSQNNIDSLENLLVGSYIDKLNLIVSVYFYSHERNQLIQYAYDRLDIENKFQLSVANTHCKLCMFETTKQHYITIHGSANLRSSGNLEQIMIENNKNLYDFNYEIHQNIIEKFKTIQKPIRSKALWQAVQKNGVN